MEIEITRYKAIVRAFNEPKKLAKLIIVIALIITLVFLGVTLIALVVKSYYPYKTVNSNEYGATVIENEDNEVIYWLFNSADLWANSGIEVKEGDVISVRTSGAFHTAIHHLVQDADTNRNLRDRWLDPMGGSHGGPKDSIRGKFRISLAAEFNTILMQVIPSTVNLGKDDNGKYIDTTVFPYLDGGRFDKTREPDIYTIGTGKDKIRIRSTGVLHFAVNDIVLTPSVIDTMKNSGQLSKLQLGVVKGTAESEIDYYEKNKFVDAWYADNVGSFLVVIERKKQ